MTRENILSQTISTAGQSESAVYDNVCKKLLANKVILAWIMKSCMEEYEDCSIEEITQKYIEGEPQISDTAVHQDEVLEQSKIKGLNTEDKSITEGTVVYDIRYQSAAPEAGGIIRLIINVEAQNDFYPGYPIIMRSMYYCSRMISAQHGTEFEKSEYDKIKKVYCIFICVNCPKNRKNTINRYSVHEEHLRGDFHEKKERYNLLTSVMICLGDADDPEGTGVLRLLEVLLSPDRSVENKKKILQEEFGIKMTEELEEEAKEMCNLSKGLIDRGRAEGRAEERQQAFKKTIQMITNLMASMNWSIKQAMDALGIPEGERAKYTAGLK